MHVITCLLFLMVTFMGFARVTLGMPSLVLLIPEFIAAIVAVVFLNRLAVHRELQLSSRYLVLFGLLITSILAGLIIAEATTGPIVSGLRSYLKYMPFFLIALVYPFTEKQLEFQLKLLLAIGILQFPLAFAQRFILYAEFGTGDMARGTFRTVSMAATFLFASLAVLVGFYLKGKISGRNALLAGIALFLTPNISENKSAIFLIPLSLLVPFALAPSRLSMGKKIFGSVAILGVTFTIFASIYAFVETRYRPNAEAEHRTSLIAFFTNPDIILNYVAPQLSGVGEREGTGRLDTIAAPMIAFSDDPTKLLTGLGFGALSVGPIEAFAADKHRDILEINGNQTSWAHLQWELGLLGTLLVLVGFLFVWRDARALRHENDIYGALALGWPGVIAVMVFAMAWKNVMLNGGIMYPFAYLCGTIVAARFRLDQRSSTEQIERMNSAAVIQPLNTRTKQPTGAIDQDAEELPPPILNEVR